MIYIAIGSVAGLIALGVYLKRCCIYYSDTSERTYVDPAADHPHVPEGWLP